MSRDLPWMKFDPVRFSDEPKLRKCSRQARSLYVDMLKLMHHARPYGHALIDGEPQSAADLAAIFGDAASDVAAWLGELTTTGALKVADTGAHFCPRMVRDWEKLERDRANGAKGGNPHIATQAEMTECANRDAVRRLKDAERKRAKRAAERAEKSSGPQTCPQPSRNVSAPSAQSPSGHPPDKSPEALEPQGGVQGLTHPIKLREETLRDLSSSETESPASSSARAWDEGVVSPLRERVTQRAEAKRQADTEPQQATLRLPPVIVSERRSA